jgi:phage tail P2-like protein
MSQYSLLPENASRLERAFERAFAGMLEGIEAPFPELLDPQRTPPAMLPYLAQDRGVAEWDGDASTELLRRTVANVWPIRRLAGTRRALVLAVDELDYDAEVVAWYDANAEFADPYHLEVIAWKRGSAPINSDITQQMLRNLDYAKSERDVLTLSLALGFSSELSLSGALNPGVTSRDDAPDGEILASPTVAATLAPVAVMEPATTTLDPAPTASSFESPEVNAALAVAGAAVWVTYTDHEG